MVHENRLVINHIDETDNGKYSCHAFNDFDRKGKKTEYIMNVISKKIFSLVERRKQQINYFELPIVPPQLSPIPPKEISIDENYHSRQVSFTCHVERGSVENLSLSWLYANNTRVQVVITKKETKKNSFTMISKMMNQLIRIHKY